MRMSTLFGRTLREAPNEAEHVGYRLALRAGLIRALQAGSFAMLPLGMRVLRQIERIMHTEMEQIDAQELHLPVIQSSAAWEQTGRYQGYGPLMLRLTDRSERNLIFAPTHEEAIADLARREITSYRHLPALVYQIATKYRDELRPKGGMLRMREFTMLDAYSLDSDAAGLDAVYQRVAGAFERIFARCGVRYVTVQASGGEMGGNITAEYHALSASGEDELVICSACSYAANAEVATTRQAMLTVPDQALPTELVETPGCATIADVARFLGVPETATAKAVFFDTPERGLVFVVIRGDVSVNEAKLRAAIGVSTLTPASSEQIQAIGAVPGYASPVGLMPAHTATIVADQSIVTGGPLVAGANQAGYHLRNVVYGRDWHANLVADLAVVRAGDACPQCGAPLTIERGVEIGHIFQFGSRYAEALGAVFLDQHGSTRPVVMGSYGIGLERLLQIVIEQHHTDQGIAWPAELAPFQIHMVRLGKSEAVRSTADALYAELGRAGQSVLYDDRDETAGVKFNDADLIGLPIRLLVSERMLPEDVVELRPRGGEAIRVARSTILEQLSAL